MSGELNNITLLEEKVRKVTDLIQSLQKERSTLAQRLQKVEAEKDALQKHQQVSVAREEENRRLRHQLEKLEVERQDLRSRVQRMLDLVSGIDH